MSAEESGASGSPGPPRGAGAAGDAEGLPAGVTLQALADRVYRMMMRDVRLERARGASGWSRGGG